MKLVRLAFLSGLAAWVVHVGLVTAIGGNVGTEFASTLAVRWLTVGFIFHSVDWHLHKILIGIALGLLVGINMAFVVATFGQPFNASVFAVAMHTVGGLGMGLAGWTLTREAKAAYYSELAECRFRKRIAARLDGHAGQFHQGRRG